MTLFLMIFRRFPTTFRRFPNIFQNCPEGQTNVPEHFPMISENFRRLPKTFEEDPKMFRWYTNEFKYNLRDKLDITEVMDIFTCEDIISSHVRISYRFYQFATTRDTTDFYIISLINISLYIKANLFGQLKQWIKKSSFVIYWRRGCNARFNI